MRFTSNHLFDHVDQVIDAGLDSAADVDHDPVETWFLGGGAQGTHHVVNVHKVARLLATSEDDERAAADDLFQVARHHGRVGGRQRLTRTVRVEDAQDDRLDFPQGADGEHILL